MHQRCPDLNCALNDRLARKKPTNNHHRRAQDMVQNAFPPMILIAVLWRAMAIETSQ